MGGGQKRLGGLSVIRVGGGGHPLQAQAWTRSLLSLSTPVSHVRGGVPMCW